MLISTFIGLVESCCFSKSFLILRRVRSTRLEGRRNGPPGSSLSCSTESTYMQPKVRTCLGFKDEAEEAARFYVSVIPDSIFEGAFRREPSGPAILVSFTLAGTPYQALNMGCDTNRNEACSISVMTKDQRETDELWEKLLANGGAEIQCSWLKDRYGVRWQIVPEALPRMFMDEDRAAAARAFQAMLGMVKIDLAKVEAAFRGESA